MPVPLNSSSIFHIYYEIKGDAGIIFRNCDKYNDWNGTPRKGDKCAIQNKKKSF